MGVLIFMKLNRETEFPKEVKNPDASIRGIKLGAM